MTAHLTWLDWYVAGSLDRWPKGMPSLGGKPPRTDLEACWQSCLAALIRGEPQVLSTASPGDPLTTKQQTAAAQFTFFGAVLSFVNPDPGRGETLAAAIPSFQSVVTKNFLRGHGVKISSRLAQAFSRAKAPQTDDWLKPLLERPWYFDLPHHVLLVGERQIRAIFTQPTPTQQGAIAAVAVLTEPGDDRIAGRYAWMLTNPGEPVHGSADIEIDRAYLERSVTDFVALVMLYRQEQAATQELPRYDPASSQRHRAKKRAAEAKTKTLFRVVALDAPPDHFGQAAESIGGGSWQLTHRVTVRGHFRWQPHGPERAQRKLIWIEEHQRGPDLDAPELNSLRQGQRP